MKGRYGLQTFGPAFLTASEHPDEKSEKFFAKRPASFLAASAYAALSAHALDGRSISLGTLVAARGTSNPGYAHKGVWVTRRSCASGNQKVTLCSPNLVTLLSEYNVPNTGSVSDCAVSNSPEWIASITARVCLSDMRFPTPCPPPLQPVLTR